MTLNEMHQLRHQALLHLQLRSLHLESLMLKLKQRIDEDDQLPHNGGSNNHSLRSENSLHNLDCHNLPPGKRKILHKLGVLLKLEDLDTHHLQRVSKNTDYTIQVLFLVLGALHFLAKHH